MDVEQHGRGNEALAELAGALARELTDPMSVVQGRLELLLELGVTDAADVRRHLQVALDHSRRVTATLRNLRLVGRVPVAPREAVPLATVVDDALDLVGPRRDRVVVDLGTDLRAGAEAPVLARVLAFLLRHALDACGSSAVHVRARKTPRSVTVRIGPSGRPRAAPVTDAPEWLLDNTMLAGIGGRLTVLPVGVGLRFEVELPPEPHARVSTPAPPPRRLRGPRDAR